MKNAPPPPQNELAPSLDKILKTLQIPLVRKERTTPAQDLEQDFNYAQDLERDFTDIFKTNPKGNVIRLINAIESKALPQRERNGWMYKTLIVTAQNYPSDERGLRGLLSVLAKEQSNSQDAKQAFITLIKRTIIHTTEQSSLPNRIHIPPINFALAFTQMHGELSKKDQNAIMLALTEAVKEALPEGNIINEKVLKETIEKGLSSRRGGGGQLAQEKALRDLLSNPSRQYNQGEREKTEQLVKESPSSAAETIGSNPKQDKNLFDNSIPSSTQKTERGMFERIKLSLNSLNPGRKKGSYMLPTDHSLASKGGSTQTSSLLAREKSPEQKDDRGQPQTDAGPSTNLEESTNTTPIFNTPPRSSRK